MKLQFAQQFQTQNSTFSSNNKHQLQQEMTQARALARVDQLVIIIRAVSSTSIDVNGVAFCLDSDRMARPHNRTTIEAHNIRIWKHSIPTAEQANAVRVCKARLDGPTQNNELDNLER